jgi:ABC-2 type transport system permease protein
LISRSKEKSEWEKTTKFASPFSLFFSLFSKLEKSLLLHKSMQKLNNRKWESLLAFSAIILVVLLVNLNASRWFFRLDLTEEERFTISEATKKTLASLEEPIFVEVFLGGDLNAQFTQFQKSIRETLEEFQIYADGKLQFEFTNPDEVVSESERSKFYQQLVQRGLPATNLNEQIDGKMVQKVIFPGAVVSLGNKEKPVLLLKGNKNFSPQEQVNQSAEGVEYELITTIRQLATKTKKRIAFIEGHDELTKAQTIDMSTTLEEFYWVERVKIGEQPLESFNAIIVAQPKSKFSDAEQFLLDQYIVGGGKAMLLLDQIQMNLDSIAVQGTYAFGYDLGLDEMLFKYGVRLENTLIQDQQAGRIMVNTGRFGDKPNIQPRPWPYYTYLNTFSEHPIVRNMDVIYGKFISTIDTNIRSVGVNKIPLVFTSKYSKVRKMPNMVSITELQKEMRVKESFNRQNVPVAYLLEGEFQSLYANRGAPVGFRNKEVKKSGQSKLIIFADGDIIRNDFDPKTRKPKPIDFDESLGQVLSNKEFILNSLAYLTDEDGIINARKKQITLRPLDVIRAKEERLYWQIINIAIPVLLVGLFGFGYNWWRKRRFTRF